MKSRQEVLNQLNDKKDIVCNCFENYGINIDEVKVYGYILDNWVGANSDLNILIFTTFITDRQRYSWEDVYRKRLKMDLTVELGLNIMIHTPETLRISLSDSILCESLTKQIIEASQPLKNYL